MSNGKLDYLFGPLKAELPEPEVEILPSWATEGRTWDLPIDIPTETGEKFRGFIRPDNTVWVGDEQIGSIDPKTGEFESRPPTAWEQMGQWATTIPLKGLEYFLKPFEYFEEYVGKPFAMAVTAPWWQEEWWESKTPEEQRELLARGYKPGMLAAETPLEMLKGFFTPEGEYRKAYTEWEAPKYLRGALEFIPWFAIPPAGRVVSLLGKAGKVGKLAALPLKPYALMEKGIGKVITLPIKVGGKIVGKTIRPAKVPFADLPPTEAILADIAVRHPERLGMGKLEKWRNVIFRRHNVNQEAEQTFRGIDVVKRELLEVRDADVAGKMNILGRIGRMRDLFKTTPDGMIATAEHIVPKKKGASMAMADIIGKPHNYKWVGEAGQKARHWTDLYNDILKEAKVFREAYIEPFRKGRGAEALREVALEEGANWVPRRVLSQIDIKTGKVLYEHNLYPTGARPGAKTPSWKPRRFKTQTEGIKQGYTYAPQDEVLEAYMTELYNMAIGERGIVMTRGFAKTPKEMMEMIEPGIRAQSEAYGQEIKDLRYIQQAINRVKRGEKLPANTLLAIGRRIPDATKILREGTKEEVNKLAQNIKSSLASIKAEAKSFAPRYRQIRQRAIQGALSEGRIIDLPAWQNKIFPDRPEWGMVGKDIVKRIEKIYTPERVNLGLRTASRMARAGVTVKAALDLSWSFIQGGMVFGYDVGRWMMGKPSNAWFRATRAMIKTIFNPKYAGEWEAKNPAIARRMAEARVVMEREAEFIQVGAIERMIKKLPLVGKFAGELIRQTYGRAGAGFSTGGKVARGEMFKAMEGAWVKEGHSIFELGEFVNKLTGVISSRELGVGATRRAIESATLFAPRYTRAYLMVMADLFRGTKTASEVRKAMAGMLIGGTLAYCTLCTTLGQEPKLNPAPKSLGGDGAEFMAFKIGDSIIGLPGFWYSTIRMMMAVGVAAEQDPERLLSLNWRENDFLRWAMGRTSPVVGFGREIIEGKDYLGRNLDKPDDWVQHFFSQYLTTIATANLITRHPEEEEGKYKRFGAELLGLRAFPQSLWEQAKELREEYSQKDFDKAFDELNLEQKDKLLEQYPEYRGLTELATERRVLEGGEDWERWIWGAQKASEAEYYTIGEDLARSLFAGNIDYRTFLEAEATQSQIYYGEKKMLNTIERLADPEELERLEKYREQHPPLPEDEALNQYWDVRLDKPRDPKTGLIDWDALERKTNSFLDTLDTETRAYVQRMKDRRLKDLPPNLQAVKRIQADGRDKVDEYYNLPEGRARTQYRRANPNVDAWLLVMGRVTRPQTSQAMQIALRLLREYGLPETLLTTATIATQSPKWDYLFGPLRS